MKNQKRYARGNAVKHGVFCKFLLTGPAFAEEEGNLLELISVVAESIRPDNLLEQIFVEKIAVLLLRQSRLYKADQALACKLFARVRDGLSATLPPPALHLINRENQFFVDRKEYPFDLLLRYDTTTERQIARNIGHIHQLRLLRKDAVNLESHEEGPHAETVVR
jgi:hypothetical protein